MSELFDTETTRAKYILLKKYRNQLRDIRTLVYDALSTAAEMKRPANELERLTALTKGFEENSWWQLKHELEELEKQVKDR